MPANKLLDKAKCLASGEDRERMPIRPVAEGLIALAVAAAHWGQHADGIVIVDGVVSGYPEFTEHYLNATTLLRAELRVGAAGKAFNAEDWANAIQLNAEAAEYHLSLGLIEQTMSCWARIHDLADRRGDPVGVVRETIRALQMLALPLEVELGDRGLTAVNALCNRILDNHGKGMGTDAAFVVCQIAKGLRFGSALRSGARYSWQKDEVGRRLLDQIGHAEAALRSEVRGSVEPAPDLLDENTILGAYVSTIEREPGATAQQRLANLQRSFDRRVSESLLLAASGQELPVYALERYQALLDERTVLAYLYLGVSEGLAAVYSFLLTREEVLSRCIPYVSGTMRVLTSNNRQAEFEMMSFSVGLLRKHLLQTPDGQRVSPEANELLEEGIDWFFGGSEVLEQLRAQGKDHLCIIPHGALHYLPFHLLGKGNVPLARQWTITYLPHPVLLFTDRVSRTSQHTAAQKSAVIGLEYRQVNPHGLPELPQSREELVEVATVLNVEPIFERDATESTVVDALTSARFVHLSMHGQHNVAAPAFQCLYTAQDKGEDGRLNAYELLSADLSRLHLVTLSACETALGRFDAGDNLRGLPAGLLLGGASCLIGTLWTVDAGASKFFFVALYTALNSGSTRLEAFSTAQRATRRRFPRYQDWGSFYLIGQWT